MPKTTEREPDFDANAEAAFIAWKAENVFPLTLDFAGGAAVRSLLAEDFDRVSLFKLSPHFKASLLFVAFMFGFFGDSLLKVQI